MEVNMYYYFLPIIRVLNLISHKEFKIDSCAQILGQITPAEIRLTTVFDGPRIGYQQQQCVDAKKWFDCLFSVPELELKMPDDV